MLKDVAIRRAAAWAVAGFLYLIWPMDLVPDWAVLVGWVDDALVVSFAAYMAYQAFQRRAGAPERRGPEHAKPVKPLPPDAEDEGL